MKENNKGITLMILSITVMLILIITSTATYYGLSAYDNAKLAKFEAELKIMQTHVELWEKEGKLNIGTELSTTQETKLASNKYGNTDISNYYQYYRYINTETIRNLGIDGIEGEYFVIIDLSSVTDDIQNVLDNRVVSVNGLKYRGNTYYTLKQLENDGLVASTYSVPKTSEEVASLTNKVTGQVSIYSSVQDAIDAAGTNPSIVTLLQENIEESVIVGKNNVKQNIILDTNGKTLTSSNTQTITNNGSITIEGNGTIENTQTSNNDYIIKNANSNSSLNLKDANLEGKGRGILNNGGIINIDGGNIKITKTESETTYANGIVNTSNGTINMTGGNIKVTNNASGVSGSVRGIFTYSGTINITGGTIDTSADDNKVSSIGIYNENTPNDCGANIIISGGTIKAISENNYAFGVRFSFNSSGTGLSTGANLSTLTVKDNASINASIMDNSSSYIGCGIGVVSANQVNSITIGNDDNTVSTDMPLITGTENGVQIPNDVTVNFFDGKIVGKQAISGNIDSIPENCILDTTETNLVHTSVLKKWTDFYTVVEYIESNGTQYIDTGVIPNQNTGIDIKFLSNDALSTSSYGSIIGGRTSSQVNEFQITTYSSSSSYKGTLRFGTTSTSLGLTSNTLSTVSVRNKVLTQATGTTTSLSATAWTSPVSMTLFALNQNGSIIQSGSVKVYYCKLYDGDQLIRDFIPCIRKSDNKPGLYDQINNEFYTNQGTGEFIYQTN